MDYIDVAVAAVNVVRKKALSREDRHVPAVYSVMVQKGLSDAIVAEAALDLFHTECEVAVLDDFVFFVFDPRTGRVLARDEDHEDYSKTHLARDCQRIADKLPKIFEIEIEAVGDDRRVAALGSVTFIADSKQDARKKAFDALWDSRLDSASCSARYHCKRLH